MGGAAGGGFAWSREARVAAPLPGGRCFGPGRAAAVGAGEPLSRRQRALSRRPFADLYGDRGARKKRRAVAAHVDQRDRVRARLRDRERVGRGHRLCHGRKRHHEACAAALDLGPLCHADHCARPVVHSLARDRHLVAGAGGHLPGAVSGTEAGLRTTSERLIEMLRSFGASPRQIFFKVSLPSAMPFILAGLKLGIGRGLIGVVVAELFGSRAGLGRLIAQSADAFNMPELFAGVVVLAAAGIVLTAGFGWLENRLVPWTKD